MAQCWSLPLSGVAFASGGPGVAPIFTYQVVGRPFSSLTISIFQPPSNPVPLQKGQPCLPKGVFSDIRSSSLRPGTLILGTILLFCLDLRSNRSIFWAVLSELFGDLTCPDI